MHRELLENNLVKQVRALPNPSFKSPNSLTNHPLTIRISPTSTASVLVTSLTPQPSPSLPCARLGFNAEVAVAPKTRQSMSQQEEEQSIDGRSIGPSRSKPGRADSVSRPFVLLRSVDRQVADEWFDDEDESEKNVGLKVWVDWSIIDSKDMKGFTWVWVSVVRPSGLKSDGNESQESSKPASRIVAQLCPWQDAPDSRHLAVSTPLCHLLDIEKSVGDIIRVEPAPPQASKSVVRSLRFYPFATSNSQKESLKLGGKDRLDTAERILKAFGGSTQGSKILERPITDGMLLPPIENSDALPGSQGGILKLHPPPGPPVDAAKTTRGWLLGSDRRIFISQQGPDSPRTGSNDRKLALEVMDAIAKPPAASSKWRIGESLPAVYPTLVGIGEVVDQLVSHLSHASSTLLTGGPGSGKTSLLQYAAHRLRQEYLASIIYIPCLSLVKEEARISTIKENLTRAFGLSTWNARLGGQAIVILDDLDKLCPAENELEVGNESRIRHISELVCSVVREHCSLDSKVALLATAQSKEDLHNIIVGGHVLRENVPLHAPDKKLRRQVLEHCVLQEESRHHGPAVNGDVPSEIDFLDLAGKTDGYMPGDLLLLISRARSEALIRKIASSSSSDLVQLKAADFDAALDGFTPSSLRNVTLQHSTTKFDSIGGLGQTLQTLRETLQYPTLYAPIFARCPLRLRSGLLLYGYPGCGKTLLASAVAGECGLNFISVKGPEILNKYIGASEKSVRDLFERAQAAKPCVLFFDEFDSIAPKRGHDSTGVTDRVVNQMLTQMDGAEGLSGVYVLAATSRPDLIDPALLRPGRLDKSLLCDLPRRALDRMSIMKAVSNNVQLGESALRRLEDVASRTEGYSGADLQALVYNAQLEAIHDVVGDHNNSEKSHKQGERAGGSRDAQTSSNQIVPDFTFFRYGEDATHSNGQPTSAAYQATERAQIAQQLQALKAAQQRARALRRESMANGLKAENERNKEETSNEPVIEWRHMEKALGQTRSSISREDLMRLQTIYEEFVDSRNGEMPSGQGGYEIGGRSSLM